jgi:NAD(P)-dependent dehydrogenase (short-subunit alcohol dehydrogenase family)
MSSGDNVEDRTAQRDPADEYDQPDGGEKGQRDGGRLDGKRARITGGDSGIGRAVTKATLNSCTEGLARMVGSSGIRVNAVAPGPIWTPLIPATMREEKIESFGQSTPLGACRSAGRAGAGIRLSRLAGVQLHQRSHRAPHRREPVLAGHVWRPRRHDGFEVDEGVGEVADVETGGAVVNVARAARQVSA